MSSEIINIISDNAVEFIMTLVALIIVIINIVNSIKSLLSEKDRNIKNVVIRPLIGFVVAYVVAPSPSFFESLYWHYNKAVSFGELGSVPSKPMNSDVYILIGLGVVILILLFVLYRKLKGNQYD